MVSDNSSTRHNLETVKQEFQMGDGTTQPKTPNHPFLPVGDAPGLWPPWAWTSYLPQARDRGHRGGTVTLAMASRAREPAEF
jgi:hypothetical protein